MCIKCAFSAFFNDNLTEKYFMQIKTEEGKLMKARTNLTLGKQLKIRAQKYAENLEMDLSELICHLLREELANPTVGQKKPLQTTKTLSKSLRKTREKLD